MYVCIYIYTYTHTQCFRKVAVHLGYGRVQLKCDGTRWRTGGEVRKVAVHLQKVMEVMSTSVYTGLNTFNYIRKHFLQICLCLSARYNKVALQYNHTAIDHQSVIYPPTDAPVSCLKKQFQNLHEILHWNSSDMFRCYSYTIIREHINLCLLKLQLLKQSIKIHRCVVNTVVVWLQNSATYRHQ